VTAFLFELLFYYDSVEVVLVELQLLRGLFFHVVDFFHVLAVGLEDEITEMTEMVGAIGVVNEMIEKTVLILAAFEESAALTAGVFWAFQECGFWTACGFLRYWRCPNSSRLQQY